MKMIKSLCLHLGLQVICLFVGFVDVVNYYYDGKPDGIPIYGDGTYISFSFFNYFVCYFLGSLFIYFYYYDEND